MGRIKTYTAYSGSGAVPESAKLYNSELDAIQDEYEGSFATWRRVDDGQLGTNTTNASRLLRDAISGSPSLVGAHFTDAVFRLDPVDYAAGGRTAKCRLRFAIITGATVPTVAITAQIAAAANPSAATNAIPTTSPNTGSFLGGAVQIPAAGLAPNSPSVVKYSAEFTMPTAGLYCIAFSWPTNGLPSSQAVRAHAQLQYRQT